MKILTRTFFLIAALIAWSTGASAQVDNTFRFVDNKTGMVIPDGGTYTTLAELIDKMPEFPGVAMSLEAPFDISVENTTGTAAFVAAELIIEQMTNGSISCCFPVDCQDHMPEVYVTGTDAINGGAMKNFQTEWFPVEGEYGTAKVTIQLSLMAENPLLPGNYEWVAYGPKITVNCVYADPAGINDATRVDTMTETARYGLDGRKLTAPSRGINIVKMADGTVRKILEK